MPPMPYHLEKGPMLEVLENLLNDTSRRRQGERVAVRMLRALRDPNRPLEDTMLVGAGTLRNAQWDAWAWQEHLARDWFGKVGQPPGPYVRPPLPPVPTSTGFWTAFEGDVEGIVRETLRRAIECALGVNHDQPLPAAPFQPVRHWRIDLFLKCAQGWFEGWVTWRKNGAGARAGQVTTIISTPGNGASLMAGGQTGSVVRLSPVPPADRQGRDYELEPVSTKMPNQNVDRLQGMWVVTHRRHEKWGPGDTTQPSPSGDWQPPIGSGITGRPTDAFGHYPNVFQPIVTVSPSEADGGVLAIPRTYS